MVTVPAGSYTMGSPAAEAGRHADEAQRRMTIEDPFAVGVYEVTFAEWDACAAGRQPVIRPVIDVSWDDAQEYVAWLSSKTGEEYRLLTEADVWSAKCHRFPGISEAARVVPQILWRELVPVR